MGEDIEYKTSNLIVWILLFCLVGLIALLLVLYKHLNKETKGEYTIRRMVYKKGGVRDQVRGTALSVGTCLGIQLWPLGTDEDGDEMQEFGDEEGQVNGSLSQGSDTEGEDEQDEDEDHAEEQCDAAKEKGDSSENYSSLEGSQAWERAGLTEEQEEKEDDAEEQSGERQEKVGEDQVKVEASGGAGLSIDLKQFSGSAIWSEEEGGDFRGSDVTAF
ncbi:acidic leucine-rich nuclear phosphoprotein 32 family member B [Brachyistius frenatus]|uniref:acidic leucine-rich nuclear phosphoprotein 32 family member B n=1 Tax=Brachyistius frenatus TaxID=100188 RepID=UPI0037E90792